MMLFPHTIQELFDKLKGIVMFEKKVLNIRGKDEIFN